MSEPIHAPARPSEDEDRILASAIRHARLVGLTFPPKVVEIFWTDDELTACGRQCDGMTYPFERPIRIYIRCGLPADRLFRICLHELLHAWDSLRWGMANAAQDEARAEIFVEFAMAPLEALGRGERPEFPLAQWDDHLGRAL